MSIMSGFLEDILSQIPEGDEDNGSEVALENEVLLIRRECSKEEIKKRNFDEFYLRRQEYTENIKMEHKIESIRKKHRDVFLHVLEENSIKQTNFMTKFLSVDLKDISLYQELRFNLIVQDGVEKLAGVQNKLDTLINNFSSMEIVKILKEKRQSVQEVENQLERVREESRAKMEMMDKSIKCSEGDIQKLIITLVMGEKATRKYKQEIAELNQQIARTESEREKEEVLIKKLEEEIKALGKQVEEKKREKEMEKFLNPRTIEHVDIFKVPLTSLRRKAKPLLQKSQIFGKGIETLLTDIRMSTALLDSGAQQDKNNSFEINIVEQYEQKSVISNTENEEEISRNEQVSNPPAIIGNEDDSQNTDDDAISKENVGAKIEVLENVLIKPPPDHRRLLKLNNENSSSFIQKDIKVTVDFSTVKQSRAVAISSDDKEKIQTTLSPLKPSLETVHNITDDEQTIGETDSRQEVVSKPSCSYGDDNKLHLVHQDSKSRQPVDLRSVQNIPEDILHETDPTILQKETKTVSQILGEVSQFLRATAPRYKLAKRKASDDILESMTSSQTLKSKRTDLPFDLDEIQLSHTAKSQTLKGPANSSSVNIKKLPELTMQSRAASSSSKYVQKGRHLSIESQSDVFREEELLKEDKTAIPCSQARPSEIKADQSEQSYISGEPIKREPKKKQTNSSDFSDFFANLYDVNESSSGINFDNDTDINFDGWSGMGEGGDAASVDFSIDMGNDGSFNNNEKSPQSQDLDF